MSDVVTSAALDRLLEQMSACLDDESLRRMSEFRVDESVQARIDLLAERANEGLLTPEENDVNTAACHSATARILTTSST